MGTGDDPTRYVPALRSFVQMIIGVGFVHTFSGLLVCRFFLGFLEGWSINCDSSTMIDLDVRLRWCLARTNPIFIIFLSTTVAALEVRSNKFTS